MVRRYRRVLRPVINNTKVGFGREERATNRTQFYALKAKPFVLFIFIRSERITGLRGMPFKSSDETAIAVIHQNSRRTLEGFLGIV